MVLDTETANTIQTDSGLDMSNVLMYDCGWAVVDTKGGIYETASYVNKDIFLKEKELMQTAYYAEKIPKYWEDLRKGERKLVTTYEIRRAMLDTLDKYNIREVAAHNARFDYNALNVIQRWTTASRYRYWFPFDRVTIWDTMKGAEQVICQMPTYRKFCEENGYITESGRLRKTAEILYRFISKNNNFTEEHRGLEDVLIESEILWYIYRQHKAMDLRLWGDREPFPPLTEIQRQIMQAVKLGAV